MFGRMGSQFPSRFVTGVRRTSHVGAANPLCDVHILSILVIVLKREHLENTHREIEDDPQ